MLLLVLAALAALPPAPAAVQSPAGLVDAVEDCRKIADGGDRLACFDRTAAAMAEARARRDFLVTDRTQVRKARHGLFGFTMPSFKLFGGNEKDDAEDDIKQIDVKIAAVAAFGYNLYAITLADGAMWQTTEESRGFTPRSGDTITIKRTAFGYMAKSGYSLARIRRVR